MRRLLHCCQLNLSQFLILLNLMQAGGLGVQLMSFVWTYKLFKVAYLHSISAQILIPSEKEDCLGTLASVRYQIAAEPLRFLAGNSNKA